MDSGLSIDKLSEVIHATRETIKPPTWEDLSRTRRRYIAAKQILKRRKKAMRGLGGTYRWDVKVDRHQQASAVGAYNIEQTAVKDMFVKANVPVRTLRGKYAFDILEEELNSGPEQVVDVIKARRIDCYGDAVDKIEEYFWADPIDPTDEITPWPLSMTILPHPSASTPPGFNGGNPTGWATKQGLNASLFTRWRNWTAGWADMSAIEPGFIYRLNEAIDKTNFQAPYPYPNASPEEDDYVFVAPFALRQMINQYLRSQNDNLGKDVRSFFGDPVVAGTPVQWVEDLDNKESMPFIGINFSVFTVVQVSGWDFKEQGPDRAPLQPTVLEVYVYKMYNIANRDPSRNFQLNYFANLSA